MASPRQNLFSLGLLVLAALAPARPASAETKIAKEDFTRAAHVILERVPSSYRSMAVEGLAKLLEDERLVCVVHLPSGPLQTVLGTADDARHQALMAAYAAAARIPGYVPKSATLQGAPAMEALCQSDNPPSQVTFGDKAFFEHSFYHPNAFMSRLYQSPSAAHAALKLVHEHTHHLYKLFSRELHKFNLTSSDRGFSAYTDEVLARSSEVTAAYMMRVKGDDSFWDTITDRKTKDYIEGVGAVYGQDYLRGYIAAYEALPPEAMRLIVAHMAETVSASDYYMNHVRNVMGGDAHTLRISLDDEYMRGAVEILGHDVGEQAGFMGFMKARSPFGYATFAEGVKQHREKKAVLGYGDVMRQMPLLTDDYYKAAPMEKLMTAAATLDKVKENGGLDYPFAVQDVQTIVEGYLQMVLRMKGFTPQQRQMRVNVLKGMNATLETQMAKLCVGSPVRLASHDKGAPLPVSGVSPPYCPHAVP